jgi:hypothetical protein
MFERFTDNARKVMATGATLAREEKSPSVRRHHMLVGLIDDAMERPDGIPALMFADAAVDLEAFRGAVVTSLRASETPHAESSAVQPMSSGAKKALELALREALSLGHNYIGCEHLLLAILRTADGPLAATVGATGLGYGTAREFVRTYVPPTRGGRGRGGGMGRREFRRMRRTDAVEQVIERAGRRANDRPVTTGDLLIALSELRGTHFARLTEGVAMPSGGDLAAAADKLVADNVADGEPDPVRVDPRSGAVTVTDPGLAEKLKAADPAKIAEALRKLLEDD